MENLITRYRNVTFLVAVLFTQVLGLAIQVKRTSDNESSRLIRVWAVDVVTPFERGLVGLQNGVSGTWRNYLYLRGVRQENRGLKEEIERLRLEQVRLNEDAQQARRLQALLGFKEQYISRTMAAQVIGSSGSEQSRSVYIDKGSKDGIERDMAVVTADGVVGKVLRTYGRTSQVLLISDQTSGVGTILEKSRLQGVLRGSAQGDLVLDKIMNDEQVQPGEKVLTSGGDQIFPKGMPLGTVSQAGHGPEAFLDIRVKPAATLSKLEEVLVITQKEDRVPQVAETGPVRAVDILAERLPSVPPKPMDPKATAAVAASGKPPAPGSAPPTKPAASGAPKPSQTVNGTNKTVPGGTPAASTGAKKPVPPSNPASRPANPQTVKPEPTQNPPTPGDLTQ